MKLTKENKINKNLFDETLVEENNSTKKSKKDLSNSLQTKYCIEIECKDEQEQELMYNKLTEKGFSCRILTL